MSIGPAFSIGTILTGASQWHLARWGAEVPRINELESQYQPLNDYELRKKSLSLRYRAQR